MWLFDVVWALAIFFGLRWLATRLLAVRLGPAAALVCGALGIGAGLGLQRAIIDESAGGIAPYAAFPVLFGGNDGRRRHPRPDGATGASAALGPSLRLSCAAPAARAAHAHRAH